MRKIWVTHNSDLTSITLHGQELEALRHAAEQGHKVRQVSMGTDLLEQLNAPAEPIQRRTKPASTSTPEVPNV